jgi:iron complex outermembrane receptor protein
MLKKTAGGLIVLALLAQSAAPAFAEGSADDLEFFESEAQVVTASRREQKVSEVPLAVDVITREDIEASGAVEIWDLLRFRVGMDVLDGRSIDGNRGVVSVEGFPQEFSPNLLVLVDGRSVYSARDNGVNWEQLPVQIQDIERIEIIRGPNAALYGGGAGLGVINIITRKPQGATSVTLDNRGGSLGLVQSYQGVESSLGGTSFRLSHTFQQEEGYPSATGPSSNDFLQKNVVNLRTDTKLSSGTELELFAGGSWTADGVPGIVDADPRDAFEQDFQRFRLTQRFSADSSVELTGSRNAYVSNIESTATGANDARSYQYDAEILHRLSWWDGRSNTTYGISYRKYQLDEPYLFATDPRPSEETYRGYLHQTVKVSDLLTIQGAFSEEDSNVEGLLPSYQAAVLLTPSEGRAFRASYSLSRTQQDLFPLYGDATPTANVRMLGNSALPAYRVTSYAAGYDGSYLQDRLHADVNLFYNKIDNFQTPVFQSFVFPTTTLQFENYDDAIARGAELDLKYRFTRTRSVYANYTYEIVSDDAGDAGLRTRNTPANKLNFGGMTDLGRGFSASANVGYKDSYFIESLGRTESIPVPAYTRVDARLAYAPPWWKGVEVYAAGQNLLAPRHAEFADGLTVPRTWSGGASIKF